MKIKIDYDGSGLCLCCGSLVVTVDDIVYEFPGACLKSGGKAYFDECGNYVIEEGPWSIKEWPENFPATLKRAVIDVVNKEIPWGCCGGCL